MEKLTCGISDELRQRRLYPEQILMATSHSVSDD